jgi:hypothetical protein
MDAYKKHAWMLRASAKWNSTRSLRIT